jgi:hypothetical protein
MKENKVPVVSVTVVGIAPLLQNRFPEEVKVEGESKIKKKVYVDKEEALVRLYQTKDGKVYQPARHFEASMIKAATNYTFEGRKSYKDAFKGGIFVTPNEIIHKYQKWEVDRQPVVVQRARIMRCRPRFDKWELTFDIQILDDRITPDVVREVLDYAGLYLGVGDMRPRYGKFQVTEFKVKK